MSTYRQIIQHIRARHGFVAQPCWIAHVKADYGLTRGVAPNRLSPIARVKPCPPHKRAAVERSLRELGLLPS